MLTGFDGPGTQTLPFTHKASEKAMWKGNKAKAWPDAILQPMNMYLPNEATKIMDLLGMKTNLF